MIYPEIGIDNVFTSFAPVVIIYFKCEARNKKIETADFFMLK